jgi:hypothetical protein
MPGSHSDETWLLVNEFPGYEVSDQGGVRSLPRVTVSCHGVNMLIKGCVLTPSPRPDGYLNVSLWRDGRRQTRLVHQLIARAFVPNPLAKEQVNHKSGVKGDNRVANLEWATRSENMRHAFDVLKHKPTWLGRGGKGHPTSKPVIRVDLESGDEKRYEKLGDVAVDGHGVDMVRWICTGKRESYRGFSWRYAS